MTSRTYKTAQGKIVDLGQLILQNENVRAVGNMNVNSRGDRLDSSNNIIDSKNQQVQRQHLRQIASNVTDRTVHASNIHAKQKADPVVESSTVDIDPVETAPVETAPVETAPVETAESVEIQSNLPDTPRGGLAAAIARSRTIVQEKEKTTKEIRQFKPGVNKI